MPRRRQRPGLGLAVADYAGHQQSRIVEGCTERMREGIAELAPLIDGARQIRSAMARNPAWKGKLFEQARHSLGVLTHIRITLAVTAFEIRIGGQRRTAVTGTNDCEYVQLARDDDPVQMGVHEVDAGRRAPVSEQARFDVFQPQRLAQQRIVEQIDLTCREEVRRAPPGMNVLQLGGREGPGRLLRELLGAHRGSSVSKGGTKTDTRSRKHSVHPA